MDDRAVLIDEGPILVEDDLQVERSAGVGEGHPFRNISPGHDKLTVGRRADARVTDITICKTVAGRSAGGSGIVGQIGQVGRVKVNTEDLHGVIHDAVRVSQGIGLRRANALRSGRAGRVIELQAPVGLDLHLGIAGGAINEIEADSDQVADRVVKNRRNCPARVEPCLLYTSDAADE